MTEFLAFACVVIWLVMGGWACSRLFLTYPELGKEALGTLAFCLILAPFAAGMALCKSPDEGDTP
jgi:hypothetical protein